MEVNTLQSTEALLLIVESQLSVYATKAVKHFSHGTFSRMMLILLTLSQELCPVQDPCKCVLQSKHVHPSNIPKHLFIQI